MYRLTESTHLCFGLPRSLLPRGTISGVFLLTYSWSRLFTCPNHITIAFLHLSVIFSTFSLSLIVDPYHSLHGFLLCGRTPIFTYSPLLLPVSSPGSHWHCLKKICMHLLNKCGVGETGRHVGKNCLQGY